MSTQKHLDSLAEMRARLKDIADRPEHHQAAAILAEVPPDTAHPSGAEARRFAGLAQAATTPLEAARNLIDAAAHWKDWMLFDGALKWQTHNLQQAARRTGKTKLSDAQQAAIRRRFASTPVKYGTITALAGEFGVSPDTVRNVLRKK